MGIIILIYKWPDVDESECYKTKPKKQSPFIISWTLQLSKVTVTCVMRGGVYDVMWNTLVYKWWRGLEDYGTCWWEEWEGDRGWRGVVHTAKLGLAPSQSLALCFLPWCSEKDGWMECKDGRRMLEAEQGQAGQMEREREKRKEDEGGLLGH